MIKNSFETLVQKKALSLLMFVFIFLWYAFQFYDFATHTNNFMNDFPIITFLTVILVIVFSIIILPKYKPREIIEIFFLQFFTLFLVVFILGNLRILPDTLASRHTRVGFDFDVFFQNMKNSLSLSTPDGTKRWDLGFNYPTVGALAYITCILSFIYLYYDKLEKKHFIMFGILTSLFYSISLIRSLMIMTPFIFSFAFFPQIKSFLTKFNKLVYLVIPFGIVLSFILPLLFHNNELLIKLTSRRISIWYRYIHEVPIKFINLNPPIDLLMRDSLDNGYLFPIFVVGILPSLIIFAGYTLLIKHALKDKDYLLLYIFIVWSVYAIIEPTFFYNYNFLLYLIPYYIFKEYQSYKKNS